MKKVFNVRVLGKQLRDFKSLITWKPGLVVFDKVILTNTSALLYLNNNHIVYGYDNKQYKSYINVIDYVMDYLNNDKVYLYTARVLLRVANAHFILGVSKDEIMPKEKMGLYKLSIQSVIDLLNEQHGKGYYAFRGATERDLEILKNKEFLEQSYEELNGTSGICIDYFMCLEQILFRYEKAKNYAYACGTGVVLLIYGDSEEYGYDDYEVICKCEFEKGAKVIAEIIN